MAVIGWPDPFDVYGPGSLLVELTQRELDYAHREGHRRDEGAKRRGSRRKAAQRGDRSRADNALGAAGELAVAVALGLLPWTVAPVGPGPDVGRWHVRTRARADWDLLVRPGERGPFVHVVQAYPRWPRELRIVGTVDVEAEPADVFLRTFDDRPPAYFIPGRALVPWRDLDEQDPARYFTEVDAFTGELLRRFDPHPRHRAQALVDARRRAGI